MVALQGGAECRRDGAVAARHDKSIGPAHPRDRFAQRAEGENSTIAERGLAVHEEQVEIARDGAVLEGVVEQDHAGDGLFGKQAERDPPVRRDRDHGPRVRLRQEHRLIPGDRGAGEQARAVRHEDGGLAGPAIPSADDADREPATQKRPRER